MIMHIACEHLLSSNVPAVFTYKGTMFERVCSIARIRVCCVGRNNDRARLIASVRNASLEKY